jgi:hypothetical protein
MYFSGHLCSTWNLQEPAAGSTVGVMVWADLSFLRIALHPSLERKKCFLSREIDFSISLQSLGSSNFPSPMEEQLEERNIDVVIVSQPPSCRLNIFRSEGTVVDFGLTKL